MDCSLPGFSFHGILRQEYWSGLQFPPPEKIPNAGNELWSPSSHIIYCLSQKGNAKECSNYRTIPLISHTSKVMLKILQARLQQYMNRELPNVQAGFYKRQRNQRSNCQHPLDHQKSKRIPEKHLFLPYWLCQTKPLTVWITINGGQFWKRWEYQTIWPTSWEICMQVRKQQLELDMKQQTGSK